MRTTRLGLKLNQLESCLTKDDVRKKILAEKDAGQALGIQSTPTYFVNGKMLVGVKLMEAEVERLLGAPTNQTVK